MKNILKKQYGSGMSERIVEKNGVEGYCIMKKLVIFLLIGIDIISVGIGIGISIRLLEMRRASKMIIGGTDGPTSIFLAGKIGKK